MKKILGKINFLKGKRLLSFGFVFVLLGVFASIRAAYAFDFVEAALTPFTFILHGIISALGFMASALIQVLVWVAQISNFIDVPAVTQGWVIVLNFCNMFFILILLIIAFATILRVESYNAKKLLPRLLIAAVLINFSKTICGFIIDFAQLIMLTFVYSFNEVGGANFANMLGLPWLMKFSDNAPAKGADFLSVIGAYILGIVYVVIAITVLGAIIGVLVVRVVMIWIHVVISPLAYLASTFPQGQSFANKWWDDFIKYVFMGPILAFFIWLSFISMQGVAQPEDMVAWLEIKDASGELVKTSNAPASLTKAGSVDHMIQFAISIGLLLGGLAMAQAAGGAMGKAAQIGAKVAKGGLTSGLDKINRMQYAKTGLDFNMKRTAGTLMAGRQVSIAKELSKGRMAADRNAMRGGLLGMATGVSSEGYWERYMNLKGAGRVLQSIDVGKHGIGVTESGRLKRMKADQQSVEDSKNAVYSQEKLDAERTAGDVEITNNYNTNLSARLKGADDKDTSLRKERADIQTEIGIQRGIVNTTASNDPKHIAAQTKIAELKIKEAEKTKEINSFDVAAEKKRILKEEDDRRKDEKLKLDTKLQLKVDNANKSKVFRQTEAEASTLRTSLAAKSGKMSDDIASFAYFDYQVQRSHNKAVQEEQKNISAEDEDQLIVQFRNAVADKNANRAEAIVRQLAAGRGTNALLDKLGYKVDPDSFSDFIKDYFEGKMKVDDQTAMQLQADLDGVGQSTKVEHLCKLVTIDETGKYRRITGKGTSDADRNRRRTAFIGDLQKQDSEKIAREATRLLYGAEDSKQEFQFSKDGLILFMNNLQGISKELSANRFNKNAAVQISKSDSAKRQLEAILNSSQQYQTIIKQAGKYSSVAEFMSALELRGAQAPQFEFQTDADGKVIGATEVKKG